MFPTGLDLRPRHRRRWGVLLVVLALLAGAGGGWVYLRSRHSGPSGAARARTAYLDAWRANDFAAMATLVHAPAADFVAQHQAWQRELGVTATTITDAGAVIHLKLALNGVRGGYPYDTSFTVRKFDGTWQVVWSPQVLHPNLAPGLHFRVRRTFGPRAAILDDAGKPLTGPGEVVVIGLVPGRVTDAAGLVRILAAQTGADPGRVRNLLARNKSRPKIFVPVITVRAEVYRRIKPVVYPVPGLVFHRETAQLTPTESFARQVLGRVGAATAEDLKRLGAPYAAGDTVGRFGIERDFERELAGTPSASLDLVLAAGRVVRHLLSVAGVPGKRVRTTLNRRIQTAAEKALDGVTLPAALVVISTRTGAVQAVVNRPVDSALDRALLGRYPPGSTFKVVTSLALLQHGVAPTSTLQCPERITVGGRTFHNFEGEHLGPISFATAFAQSCNTAFIGAARRLTAAQLLAAATSVGFNASGATAGEPGRMPQPRDVVELAADAIGQGRVTASPVAMASVVAAIARGTWVAPQIVLAEQAAPLVQLPASVLPALRALMRGVVTGGTGTAANVPGPPVFGKTGTAEYSGATPPPTHAWFIGYRGDVAFAVLVEGGGVGGRVAAPLAAKFLRALG